MTPNGLIILHPQSGFHAAICDHCKGHSAFRANGADLQHHLALEGWSAWETPGPPRCLCPRCLIQITIANDPDTPNRKRIMAGRQITPLSEPEERTFFLLQGAVEG